jgi:rfaE bifunctional protein kinase chain/domain
MNPEAILGRFPSLRALVAGDICVDRWCTYDPAEAEPSRETGIPRIGVVKTEVTPGAGGTVANNLAALGAGSIQVLGVTGDDGFAYELRQALAARGIRPDLLVPVPGMQTFTYTKLLNAQTGQEDLPRVDWIQTEPLPAEVERQVLDTLQQRVDDFDVILISDQAESRRGGVVTEAMRTLLADLAPAYPEKIFWVDSRQRIHLFSQVILKPNEQEAAAACRQLCGRVDYAALREHTASPLLVVTHGGAGVTLADRAGVRRIDTKQVENPVDICGAGDSFSAGAALALAATGDPETAVRFGHLVASITILKKGTGTASPAEVCDAYARG